MNRLALSMLLPAIAWLGCSNLQKGAPKTAPSFVIILADDLGWADVSCQGSVWKTPAIDALAADGIRFTRAASNGPNCAPSRACLVTGTDVTRHGIFTVRPAARGKKKNRRLEPPRTEHKLKPEAITIAEMLANHGYRSAHIGKWHLGADPAEQGFDVSIAGDQRGHPKTHLAPWNLPHLEEQKQGTALADALTDHAVQFIEQNADQPFLLILSHYAVHTPVQAPPDEIAYWANQLPTEKKKRHRYAALVDSVDRSVRRVRQSLEQNDCSDRTLLIFTSDNGGHEGFTDNGPLRGGKGMLFEGGVRVPFIAWGHGTGASERVSEIPIQLSDLVPTFLEMAKVPTPQEVPLEGVSLTRLLNGNGSIPERDLVWHFPAYLQGYTALHGPWRTTPVTSIVRGPWKMLEFHEDQRRLLFHLERDPSEQHDLADQQVELVHQLANSLDRWRKQRNAPMPRPINHR
ncbi:MAG: sulfatase [Planctomycetota bacterium]|nr:sulfatase [Planctomycetota bacterium]